MNDDRKIITLKFTHNKHSELLQHLKGHVFHLTLQTSYELILCSKKICHNRDGRFGINTSSKCSYGRLKGYICFFDLRDQDDHFIREVLDKYYFLAPSWFAVWEQDSKVWDLAYLILDPSYYDQLIPYEKAREELKTTGENFQVIPNAEVWIPDEVPMEWIAKVIMVEITKKSPAKGSLERALWDLEAKEEK